jgi:hypothetical protein
VADWPRHPTVPAGAIPANHEIATFTACDSRPLAGCVEPEEDRRSR